MLARRALLLAAAAAPLSARAAPDGGWRFGVQRNGDRIGHHTVRVIPDDGRTLVETHIELEVRLAFVTLYRYRHRNREAWDGDRLVSLSSRTDDNGTLHQVEVQRRGERLLVETGSDLVERPGNMVPTSYWRRANLGRTAWLDTQTGKQLALSVETRGRETILAAGRQIQAERFALYGDAELDLWYQGERWVKLAFAGPDGSAIDYVLDEGALPPQGAA